jgi:hypothetical protein
MATIKGSGFDDYINDKDGTTGALFYDVTAPVEAARSSSPR